MDFLLWVGTRPQDAAQNCSLDRIYLWHSPITQPRTQILAKENKRDLSPREN